MENARACLAFLHFYCNFRSFFLLRLAGIRAMCPRVKTRGNLGTQCQEEILFRIILSCEGDCIVGAHTHHTKTPNGVPRINHSCPVRKRRNTTVENGHIRRSLFFCLFSGLHGTKPEPKQMNTRLGQKKFPLVLDKRRRRRRPHLEIRIKDMRTVFPVPTHSQHNPEQQRVWKWSWGIKVGGRRRGGVKIPPNSPFPHTQQFGIKLDAGFSESSSVNSLPQFPVSGNFVAAPIHNLLCVGNVRQRGERIFRLAKQKMSFALKSDGGWFRNQKHFEILDDALGLPKKKKKWLKAS